MSINYKISLSELRPELIKQLEKEYGDAKVEITIHPPASSLPKMDEVVFWEIISLLDWSKGEDSDAILAPAAERLSQFPVEGIFSFQNILAEKLFALDKKIYAENLGEDAWRPGKPFSSDNFLYARACVVANGKSFYEKVLAEPSLMPKEFTFEDLLYLAEQAYEMKIGQAFDFTPEVSYETFSNPEGWNKTLKDRFLR